MECGNCSGGLRPSLDFMGWACITEKNLAVLFGFTCTFNMGRSLFFRETSEFTFAVGCCHFPPCCLFLMSDRGAGEIIFHPLASRLLVDVVTGAAVSCRSGKRLHQLRNRLVQGLCMRLAGLTLHEREDATMELQVNALKCSGALRASMPMKQPCSGGL